MCIQSCAVIKVIHLTFFFFSLKQVNEKQNTRLKKNYPGTTLASERTGLLILISKTKP